MLPNNDVTKINDYSQFNWINNLYHPQQCPNHTLTRRLQEYPLMFHLCPLQTSPEWTSPSLAFSPPCLSMQIYFPRRSYSPVLWIHIHIIIQWRPCSPTQWQLSISHSCTISNKWVHFLCRSQFHHCNLSASTKQPLHLSQNWQAMKLLPPTQMQILIVDSLYPCLTIMPFVALLVLLHKLVQVLFFVVELRVWGSPS